MDEEKTIDEAVEEQADEMKEFEPVAFDEIIKEEPVKESAPVLRALGDPEPADMNMVHKHLDNFLAMLCGETPIDDNVRTSTEYWLKRLAEGNGGSTKKVYWHTVGFKRSNPNSGYDDGYLIILSNSAEPITLDAFLNLLKTPGFVGLVINGKTSGDSALPNPPTGANYTLCTLYYVSDTTYGLTFRKADNTIGDFPGRSISNFTVTDLGVNAIN